MRRRVFHICAFCCGLLVGSVASLLAFLTFQLGPRRMAKVLLLLLGSINQFPIKGFIGFVLFFAFFYTLGTVEAETSKLRPNRRYAISGALGAGLAAALIAIIATLIHFAPLLKAMDPEIGSGLAELALISLLAVLPFAARHFTMEIEPGLGYCHHCGYDVRTIDSTQCPECGEPIISSVSVKAVRNERDLVELEHSRFAIVYLRHSEERLEEESWVKFIRNMRKNVEKFPDADVYEVDVVQPLIKQWLDSPSRGQQLDTSDRVAFMARGVILWTASRFTASYYLGCGADLLPRLMEHQQEQPPSPPAHFPNSFKKSACIGRPSSLIFPYKH